ncbi:MAG: Fic family protein [Xanthobacteraceae bacterium]
MRAGHYQKQLTGYSAFVPKPLPPQPPITFDGELQALLSKADRALGRLDGSIQTLPNPNLFVFMYVRKEAVLSSQIEGTQSSINDILKVEAKVFDRERPHDVNEVLNYVAAMDHGLNRLQELPLSLRLICEIHERLLKNVRGQHNKPGEWRRTQNWIGPPGSMLAEASFVPPAPHDAMKALGELEMFMHADDALPALIKIGLVHAQFETIHPFLDGNGRVGRLLITFLLCQNSILIRPVLYISHYFKKHRAEYYERLQAIRDKGEWELWLKFFLAGIAEVSLEATETARKIVALREAHRQTIVEKFGRAAGNGLIILENLFERPIVNVGDISKKLNITFAAANNMAQRLYDAKILSEITGQQRYRVFSYQPYVSLFSSRETEDLDE